MYKSEVKLDRRIEFIVVNSNNSFDENGFPIMPNEDIYYSCWSNVLRVSHKEFMGAYTTNTKIINSFRCRKCKKLIDIDSNKFKIKFKGKLYNIVYINPYVDEDNMYIDFKAEVVE